MGCSGGGGDGAGPFDAGVVADGGRTLDAAADDGDALAVRDAADATTGIDAAPEGGADAVACVPATATDSGLVDGEILGLPSILVPTTPPITTPQVAVLDPALNYPKQVAVVNMSSTVTDAQSVAHMLAPMGIPYAIMTTATLATAHDMAIFFPEATTSNFDSNSQNLLQLYLQGGGVIVMKYSDVAFLKGLGGVASSTLDADAGGTGLEHHWVTLTAPGKARFPSLDQPAEQKIPLGGDSVDYLNTWAMTVDSNATGVSVLATFEDGTAAIVEHAVGSGRVVTFGVDWRDVVLRNQLGHANAAARGYINLFEPATDTWMLMLRDLYDATVRFGVRLHTAPGGVRAALLLSHDLDWGPSYTNAIQYAADEQAHGASATFFVHTKYVTDYQDVAFFTADREPQLAQMMASGGRVGSHTVAHSPVLDKFPIGDGTEVYPTYTPVNVSVTETDGATLFGELRVSKSLIDAALATQCIDHDTVTFRAGNLSYNLALPQTMERVGYRFDSTRAIGDVLSNFPYRAMTDWPDGLDTSVFEFPVTIEDQQPPRLDQRTADALVVIGANADNGAPTTLLIHPNVLDFKENAELAILDGLPAGVKAMSIDEYGAFWRARDAVRITGINYNEENKTLTVTLSSPLSTSALTLRVDSSVTTVISPSTATIMTTATGNLVLLPPTAAGATLVVTLGYTDTP